MKTILLSLMLACVTSPVYAQWSYSYEKPRSQWTQQDEYNHYRSQIPQKTTTFMGVPFMERESTIYVERYTNNSQEVGVRNLQSGGGWVDPSSSAQIRYRPTPIVVETKERSTWQWIQWLIVGD